MQSPGQGCKLCSSVSLWSLRGRVVTASPNKVTSPTRALIYCLQAVLHCAVLLEASPTDKLTQAPVPSFSEFQESCPGSWCFPCPSMPHTALPLHSILGFDGLLRINLLLSPKRKLQKFPRAYKTNTVLMCSIRSLSSNSAQERWPKFSREDIHTAL